MQKKRCYNCSIISKMINDGSSYLIACFTYPPPPLMLPNAQLSLNLKLLPIYHHIAGLVQERRNSIANALELRLSCANRSLCVVKHLNANIPFCEDTHKIWQVGWYISDNHTWRYHHSHSAYTSAATADFYVHISILPEEHDVAMCMSRWLALKSTQPIKLYS